MAPRENAFSYVANDIYSPSVDPGSPGNPGAKGTPARVAALPLAGGSGPVESSVSGPLGIHTKFAAASAPDVLARCEKWELQAVARRLLPGSRLRVCCICLVPNLDGENGVSGVKVLHSLARGSAHYGGLMRCASVWVCPVCSSKISEVRRAELQQVIDWWRARDAGLVAMLTLTTAHTRHDDLGALLAALRSALRSMTKSRRYRALFDCYEVTHTVRGLETTWGYANGWHPHFHILLYLPSTRNIDPVEDEVYSMWAAAAARVGLLVDREHGVKLQATTGAIGDYVSKYGKSKWSAADELARANTKRGRGARFAPFDLLRQVAFSGESQFADLFVEYARVFKGQQHLTFSKGLRAAAGLDDTSDEQVVDELHEDAMLLATLGEREWAAVRALGLRGQVLEVARAGDRLALVAYLRDVVVRAAALN